MKVLIAYDGSECARSAIGDLQLAGLPPEAHARVITVAEVWPELTSSAFDPMYGSSMMDSALTVENARVLGDAANREAQTIAAEGAERVRKLFPQWQVETSITADAPAAGILDEAEHWHPDLIVVGSHGRSAVARVFYGSVSHKIVKYASASVRVARGRADRAAGPIRILVALDGSPESDAALEVVSTRRWPGDTQACILTVLDTRLSMTFPTFQGNDVLKSVQETGRLAAKQLHDAGLDASPLYLPGDPKRAIVSQAQQWKADCIFLGTHGLGRARRFLLGTAAAAVVSRAHCSVEVVRLPK